MTNLYSEIFFNYKHHNPVIVEVGVLDGGSIELARSYFGKAATIYGIDMWIRSHVTEWAIDKTNVKLISGDAYSPKIASIIPRFDIFIDDGPHTLDSQKKSIELYLPKLKTGGTFVIEDVQTDDDAQELLNFVPTDEGFSAKMMDFRDTKQRYDDMAIVIKRED